MTTETIKNAIVMVASHHPITRVVLFGSRAAGTNHDDSDIDLIMEFSESVSLLRLSEIRLNLEELLGVSVDIVHGPVRDSDLIEINEEIEIYAA